MMKPEERRQLAAIERQMLFDDPAFARLFTRSLRATASAWQEAVAAVVGTLFALTAAAGLLADSVLLVVSGASITVAGGGYFAGTGARPIDRAVDRAQTEVLGPTWLGPSAWVPSTWVRVLGTTPRSDLVISTVGSLALLPPVGGRSRRRHARSVSSSANTSRSFVSCSVERFVETR